MTSDPHFKNRANAIVGEVKMLQFPELPDCFYLAQPILVTPETHTPKHFLYLSNLDDQNFLRFSIKYLYLFNKAIDIDILKCSLSRVLVHYYPLAGRLRKTNQENDHKLQVDCNGSGALFAQAFMDITAQEFLQISNLPNSSWRKLLYRCEGLSFLDIPPLVVQVTDLRCGAMILSTSINHCVCDGIGTSQFLHAWAHLTRNATANLPITPYHSRHLLKPRIPPEIQLTHPGYTTTRLPPAAAADNNIFQYLRTQPLIPSSLIFTPSLILQLKKQCTPSLKCTTFEVLASHTWRSWVKSLDVSTSSLLHNVKLLFSMNVRKQMKPELPQGYYGNGFVLGCAESRVNELVNSNLQNAVKLVQHAKKTAAKDDYVRSIIDLMEEDKSVRTDLSTSLVISQWSKFGLEDLDFGEGKPLHMGPLTSDVFCLFLPVYSGDDYSDNNGVRVLISMPESIVRKFEYYMMEFLI